MKKERDCLMREGSEGMVDSGSTGLALVRRLLHRAGSYRWHIAGIIGLHLLAALLVLLTPLPLKIAVDSAMGGQPLPGLLEHLSPAAVQASSTGILILAVGLL